MHVWKVLVLGRALGVTTRYVAQLAFKIFNMFDQYARFAYIKAQYWNKVSSLTSVN